MPFPTDLTVITVTGTYEAIDGSLATGGTVTFDPGGTITDSSGKVIFGNPATVAIQNGQITSAGELGITLPCTDNADMAPSGFVYTVTEKVTGWQQRSYKIQLPSSLGTTVDLAQLAPLGSGASGGAGVSSVNGKAGAVTLTPADVGAVAKAGDTMTGPLSPKMVTLTDAATINVDASLGNEFRVTLAANRSMGAPTNPVDGQAIRFHVTQDATGSRTLTWTSGARGFNFGSAGAPTLSTTASAVDLVGFVFDSTKNQWLYAGIGRGF